MAKKSKTKPAKKAPAKKAAAKRTVKKPSAKLAPKPVKTGSGPGPAEIGRDLVNMFNQGLISQIEGKWWSPKIVSVEGYGVGLAWAGRKAVEAKNQGWYQSHILHGASAEGPFVGSSGFSVRFRMDVEDKTNGTRNQMDEVGVYTVQNGKIVREEFMYGM